ncbi:MAG: hypothetical protein Q9201_001364 [Fulgogasparrea decipioides]
MAIEEWVKLRDGQSVSLERALAAFDQFVLHGREGDFDEVSTPRIMSAFQTSSRDSYCLKISARLDDIAQSIHVKNPEIQEATPQQKAKLVARYLCSNKLTGVADNSQYHNLRNSFIGLALQNGENAALPLISVVIFCAVSKRVGLVAAPCGFPFHVYAIVKAPDGHDLDGRPLGDSAVAPQMYMDPFTSDQEVPRTVLQTQLKSMGVPLADHEMLLGASTAADMVRRTARNIIGSIQNHGQGNASVRSTGSGSFDPESDEALYSALWALLLLPEAGEGLFHRARYLPYILELLEKEYLVDARLIERFALPVFERSQHWEQLRDAVRVMRAGDSMPKQVKPRTPQISKSVSFRVGQIFRHKRYNYQAVITGWDVECAQSENWMSQMRVDQLSRGRHQSFYHVLVEDKSVRYVAEENIDSNPAEVGVNLMSLAGRHFKRWDNSSRMFVSNIRDEYPDD